MGFMMRAFINFIGLALGLVLAGVYVDLMWPEFVIHMYDAKAFRRLALLVFGALAIVGGVTWPFTWLSKRV
jgi:hypothetical protein